MGSNISVIERPGGFSAVTPSLSAATVGTSTAAKAGAHANTNGEENGDKPLCQDTPLEESSSCVESVAGAAAAAVPSDDDADTWTCEFCGTVNEVDLDPAEIPTSGTVDYVLMPAKKADVGASHGS